MNAPIIGMDYSKTHDSLSSDAARLDVNGSFHLKISLGSGGISFRWFRTVKCIALFHYKIVLVPDLGRLVYC